MLLEHQSKPDPRMPLRLFLYMGQLWAERQRMADHAGLPEGQLRLHPVIPLVFYTGEGRWETQFDLSRLMDLPEELAWFVPRWDILFLNLHGTSPDMLTRFSTAVGYDLQVMQAENAPLAELEQVVSEALAA